MIQSHATDVEFARGTLFGERVAHGLLGLSIASGLASRLGFVERTAQARQLAYRLYSICERKSWAEHTQDYNALVILWSASQEQAREFKEQVQQGRLL